jgi:A/G-specific adenine glycosylase
MEFSKQILNWYAENKRDLPWREEGIEPYKVVVSEIMLQQTQVSRVIEKFHEFLSLFPTIFDLAKASKAEVIASWSGLGYNRRALMLHKFAQEVVEKFDGKIPSSPDLLITLPGIGPYAAGSIASFAFNLSHPAVDVNVRRIYLRYFEGRDQGLPGNSVEEKKLYALIEKSIPSGKSCDLHNALMDFGSLVCTRNSPSCSDCVLSSSCTFAPLYKENGDKALFVMEKKKEKGVSELGKHIPNRIFRGRIVEYVRKNAGLVKIDTLGENIKKDYTTSDKEWLIWVCTRLQKDGMLNCKISGDKIELELGK